MLASNSTLPVEVLNEIFLHSLPRAYKGNFDALPTESHPAVAVSQTCKLWRQTALRSSALWTEIFIQLVNIQDPHRDDQDRVAMIPRLELVNLWLERSGKRSLSVVVDSASSDWAHSELLSRLLQEVHRWRHIDLKIGGFDSNLLATLDDVVTVPRLETFALRTNVELKGPALAAALPSAIWKESPLLRRFSLVAGVANNTAEIPFTNWSHPIVLRAPYSQLTHLCLGGPARGSQGLDISEVILLLSLSENLVSCIFTSVNNYADPDDLAFEPKEPIPLQKIENLSITANSLLRDDDASPEAEPFSISLLLKYFRMPNLKSLVLADDDCWESEGLIIFLETNECKLDELVLHVVTEVWEVLEYMILCSELTTLCTSVIWTLEKNFLRELVEYCNYAYRCDFRLFCPKIEEFGLPIEACSSELLESLVKDEITVPSNKHRRWTVKSLLIFNEGLHEVEPEKRETTLERPNLEWMEGLQHPVEVNTLPSTEYTVQWVKDFSSTI